MPHARAQAVKKAPCMHLDAAVARPMGDMSPMSLELNRMKHTVGPTIITFLRGPKM